MNRQSLLVLGALCAPFILTACAPFSFQDKRAGICNELNSKMIFSGGTSNARKADIQNSDRDLLQKTYEQNHCDDKS